MAKYVMSDIHGCFDKFIDMLKLINFNGSDELYILGDIFDRGDEPIKVLEYVVNHNNIILIKGNHEKLFEGYYDDRETFLWFMNGGKTTFDKINEKGMMFEENLYDYISKLPLYKIVDNFILIHAGLHFPSNYEKMTAYELLSAQQEKDFLWNRENIGNEKCIKGYTIICGHTPVQLITRSREDVKILKQNDNIYMDCGCVFEDIGGKLACLRLDDMEEFYV